MLNVTNSVIFDNYFGATSAETASDISYDTGNNWNIEKTRGKNIVGGPFIGGNYWYDYMGQAD